MSIPKPMKVALVVLVAFIVIVIAIGARLKWAASTPSRPKALPATAIWIAVQPEPLEFSPKGYWLACWLDRTRNVDRCKLTDYKGHSKFEADYSPLAGPSPVPEARLHLQSVSSTTVLWTKVDKDVFLIVHLQDGTILVPTENLAELRCLLLNSKTINGQK